MQTTAIDAADLPMTTPPPPFAALLARRMDEGEAIVAPWGDTLVLGKVGAPAIAVGCVPPDPFGLIVRALDSALGHKVNRMCKPTIVGPVRVRLQHHGGRRKLWLDWNGPCSAHERLAFLRGLDPLGTLDTAWL